MLVLGVTLAPCPRCGKPSESLGIVCRRSAKFYYRSPPALPLTVFLHRLLSSISHTRHTCFLLSLARIFPTAAPKAFRFLLTFVLGVVIVDTSSDLNSSLWRVKAGFHTLPQVAVGAAVGAVDAVLWYHLCHPFLLSQARLLSVVCAVEAAGVGGKE